MTTSRVLPHSINLRSELRRALFAAAEACWIYAVVLTLGTFAGLPKEVSALGIFVVSWIGLLTGRLLPRSKRTWRLLQILTVFIGFAAILLGLRIGLYSDTPLTDLFWLPNYFSRALHGFERLTPEIISTLALVFAFVRALGFAQRPLTLWVVGFEFRLGIVIFFAAALFAALTTPVNFIPWIFAYFLFSLLAITLARIEEAGQERALGWRWAVVLVMTIAATMLIGFVLTQLFTLDTVNAFFDLLAPLGFILQIIITVVAIPFLLLFEFLLDLLIPVFQLLLRALSQIVPNVNFASSESQRVITEVTRQLEVFAPYLRLLGVIAIVLGIAWIIARALNRRMEWAEEEMFVSESLDRREALELERRKRKRAASPAHREVGAENVRRIYAALLAHTEALGLARRPAETPLEFLPRLVARFPDSSADLDTITNAYVAVHYAQHPATDDQVRELRTMWARVKGKMSKVSNSR